MLSTALNILEAAKSSIFDEDIMGLAGELHTRRNELNDETFAKFLFMYSSALASKVADQTCQVCLTPEQYQNMVEATLEMENMSENIYEEMGE